MTSEPLERVGRDRADFLLVAEACRLPDKAQCPACEGREQKRKSHPHRVDRLLSTAWR